VAETGTDGTPEGEDASLTEELRRNFGDNLRTARIKAGMSQAQLAKRVGLKQQYVSRVEIGTQNLSLATMVTFARVFGQDVVTMLGRPRDETTQD
jgi:transcriptional regulator with XRE-family HTH domain